MSQYSRVDRTTEPMRFDLIHYYKIVGIILLNHLTIVSSATQDRPTDDADAGYYIEPQYITGVETRLMNSNNM